MLGAFAIIDQYVDKINSKDYKIALQPEYL